MSKKEKNVTYQTIKDIPSDDDPNICARIVEKQFSSGTKPVFSIGTFWKHKDKKGYSIYVDACDRKALHQAVDNGCDYLESLATGNVDDESPNLVPEPNEENGFPFNANATTELQ